MTGSRPKILVGIDGSEDGIRATRYAIGRAKRLDRDLWFVNAVDDGAVSGGWGVIYDPTVLKEAGQAAVKQASDLAIAKGIDSDRIRADVVIGNPTPVLTEFSKEAEILIVGRRASSGLERMFVGSTSTALVSSAYCPLVVISAASTPEPTGKFNTILVGMGGSGDTALRWACQEARSLGCRVNVVHVIPYQPTGVVSFLPATAAQEKQWEQRVLAGLDQLVDPVRRAFSDVDITVRSQRGVLADELIQESAKVDLLTLGVKTRPSMILGGPVRAILAHAACPVALINR
ncbi:MAG: universal stress protein [Propionibacteriaceae bacterium]|jgi:nucleotide-binding universal stress UspA family protein|nr:universal stress protein [Propionibacteriaceae bacterium]